MRNGRGQRDPQRAATALPIASPAMKLPSTMLDVQTLLPSMSPARRSHRASKSRAAAPDKNAAKLRRCAIAGRSTVVPFAANE
jgi:hypothetical protein